MPAWSTAHNHLRPLASPVKGIQVRKHREAKYRLRRVEIIVLESVDITRPAEEMRSFPGTDHRQRDGFFDPLCLDVPILARNSYLRG